MRKLLSVFWSFCVMLLLASPAFAQEQVFRLYDGVTLYADNPDGKAFSLSLDVRDLNLLANGPREVLVKVYDPNGKVVARQIIPDDGCASPNFPERIGGWDHELQYYANLYAKGTTPSYRWSAWSDPARLNTQAKRTFDYPIPAGVAGVYRVVIAGTPDHYITVRFSPDMKFGVAGHPGWVHGHTGSPTKYYVYVPKGTTGMFMAVVEPDMPRTRQFTVTDPQGKVLFDSPATGGFVSSEGGASWRDASIKFEKPGQYDGQVLTLTIGSTDPKLDPKKAGDYMVRIVLQRDAKDAVLGNAGTGASAVLFADKDAAVKVQGGSFIDDGQLFWHPFQAKLHRWLKANPLNATDEQKALRKELEFLQSQFRQLEVSDAIGTPSWANWAYGMGYYNFKAFRPSWALMQRADVPAEVKDILREAMIMAGDRVSFAVNAERVNGNAFSQLNLALWYAHQATKDQLQKDRFEVFWSRWKNGEWGLGAGLSKSGDSQEHFAHDMHYGSYLLDNWQPNGHWVPFSIIVDAKDDKRFAEVVERYKELYSYLWCQEAKGRAVPANPWSSRTPASSHKGSVNFLSETRPWKGLPGPDFTVNVNDGGDWYAARRPGYYVLTFHGNIAPEWMVDAFEGQAGFGGGVICQFTVPGKGPVLVSSVHDGYGKGMSIPNWRNFKIHSLSGVLFDGRDFVAANSEHDPAKLEGNKLTSSGEVRNSRIRSTRSYTYEPDGMVCEVKLSRSDYAKVLSIWADQRKWSEVKEAWEILPFLGKQPDNKTDTIVTCYGSDGKEIGALTAEGTAASKVKIDRGGFGLELVLDQSTIVKRGNNDTVMILLANQPNDQPLAPDKIALKYKLVPFGAGAK